MTDTVPASEFDELALAFVRFAGWNMFSTYDVEDFLMKNGYNVWQAGIIGNALRKADEYE